MYLHKAVTMRDGAFPAPWPPPGLNDEDPVALLDRAYAELTEEFGRRDPEQFAPTWYDLDQTVGFWIRRMAQETVIHRIDAELGADLPIAPIPDDLAIDGIDELLKIFVAYEQEVPRGLRQDPSRSPGRSYAINTDGVEWLVGTAPGSFTVGGGPGMTVPALQQGRLANHAEPQPRYSLGLESGEQRAKHVAIAGYADLTELQPLHSHSHPVTRTGPPTPASAACLTHCIEKRDAKWCATARSAPIRV